MDHRLNRILPSAKKNDSLIPRVSYLKKAIFLVANWIGCLCGLFPTNRHKVVWWSKNLKFEGNAKALFLEWQRRKPGYTHIWLMDRQGCEKTIDAERYMHTRKIFLNSLSALFHLATAGYWIRETDVASPGIIPRGKTVVVQLWHAAGAFKKFGLDVPNRSADLIRYREKDARRWDLLLCSSQRVVDIYRQAFGGIDRAKIVVSGLPRNDFIFHCLKHVPEIKKECGLPPDKIIVLYAPTFRDNGLNSDIFQDVVSFLYSELPEDYCLAVRLHPALSRKVDFDVPVVNLSFGEAEPVLACTDLLITDYSSIIFDYAILERPMIFYVPDLEEYIDSRGFYYPFETLVPGPICRTKKALLAPIINLKSEEWIPRIKSFKNEFQPDFDGRNCERVLERILSLER